MGKVEENKCQKHIQMSEDGVKLQLPPAATLEKHDELLSWREQLNKWIVVPEEPKDHLEQQESIQDELESIHPLVIDMLNEVAKAAEAFHASVCNQRVWEEMDNLVGRMYTGISSTRPYCVYFFFLYSRQNPV